AVMFGNEAAVGLEAEEASPVGGRLVPAHPLLETQSQRQVLERHGAHTDHWHRPRWWEFTLAERQRRAGRAETPPRKVARPPLLPYPGRHRLETGVLSMNARACPWLAVLFLLLVSPPALPQDAPGDAMIDKYLARETERLSQRFLDGATTLAEWQKKRL